MRLENNRASSASLCSALFTALRLRAASRPHIIMSSDSSSWSFLRCRARAVSVLFLSSVNPSMIVVFAVLACAMYLFLLVSGRYRPYLYFSIFVSCVNYFPYLFLWFSFPIWYLSCCFFHAKHVFRCFVIGPSRFSRTVCVRAALKAAIRVLIYYIGGFMDFISRRSVSISFSGKSRTRQEFKDECDINTIVRRFGVTGQLPTMSRIPQNADFSDALDFREAMNAMVEARESFDVLPSRVRARFHNDPAEFVDFCSAIDSEGKLVNAAELDKLGLREAPLPPAARLEDVIEAVKAGSDAALEAARRSGRPRRRADDSDQ